METDSTGNYGTSRQNSKEAGLASQARSKEQSRRASGDSHGVHSPLYDEIKNIPTGNYNTGRKTRHPQASKGALVNEVREEHLKKKVKTTFNGIFKDHGFEHPLESEGKLPKLYTGQYPDPKDKVPHVQVTDAKLAGKDFAGRTMKNKTSRTMSEDPVLQLYSTARKQIRENIAEHAGALKQKGVHVHSSNQKPEPNQTSGDGMPMQETMNTLEHNSSTIAGAMTKYKAQFRLRNKSHLNSPQTGDSERGHVMINTNSKLTMQASDYAPLPKLNGAVTRSGKVPFQFANNNS